MAAQAPLSDANWHGRGVRAHRIDCFYLCLAATLCVANAQLLCTTVPYALLLSGYFCVIFATRSVW